MAIRVFERLGRWVTLDDEGLRRGTDRTARRAADARTRCGSRGALFARAVETPGGLKIDTIHAFCERLLHLVPFEANVPGAFRRARREPEPTDAGAGDREGPGGCGLGGDFVLAEALDTSARCGRRCARRDPACRPRRKRFLQRCRGARTALGRLRAALGLAAGRECRGGRAGDARGRDPRRAAALADDARCGQEDGPGAGGVVAAPSRSGRDRAERCRLYLTVFFTDEGCRARIGTSARRPSIPR